LFSESLLVKGLTSAVINGILWNVFGIYMEPLACELQDLKPNEEFILICAQPKWTEKFITACSTGLLLFSHLSRWWDEFQFRNCYSSLNSHVLK